MSLREEPLVTVMTPVYNGGAHLAECIESVLAQNYPNFEYYIINNHSSDDTLEIAQKYEKLDKRVKVFSNDTLLDVIASHNRAFKLLPDAAKYCKIVSGDDWILPDCLTRMVEVFEANPTVGLVGCYQLSGSGRVWDDWEVKWGQIPYPSVLVPGSEVSRIHFLGGPYVYGNPTSLMYRADLVRKQDKFYPNSTAEADTSACCRVLQESDYGFVHQVLCYERVHQVRVTTRSQNVNAYLSSNISDLLTYGGKYLTPEERDNRFKELMNDYYRFLAISALKFRESTFWAYHKRRLGELGYPFSGVRLAKSILMTLVDLLLNPKRTVERFSRPIWRRA